MSQQYLNEEQLMEKWSPVLDHAELPSISDSYKKRVTAVLLENQERSIKEDRQMLAEAGSLAGNAANYDPILIGLVRRSMPQLIAYDICGVQPMTGPSGLVFAMKSRYVDNATQANRTEALFNEANPGWSGDANKRTDTTLGTLGSIGTNPVATTDGLDPWDSTPTVYTAPGGMSTANAEVTNPQEMTFGIEKMTVTATSRALKAEYTIELQQDLKAIHGLDAEAELSNILSSEITAEINREVVRTMYTVAQTGAQTTAASGIFDLDVDSNGRWSVERFKGLMFQIEREANRIGQLTRRGRGNFLLVSADVASALSMTGMLDSKLGGAQALNVDDTSTTFAGTLNGKFKVYVDPYVATAAPYDQVCLVGYRGTSAFDAGLFYCPYVPLQLLRAVDPTTFQPKIGFKTRYGLLNHPLAASTVGSTPNLGAKTNNYFRLFRVANLA